ncbi:hypothetical protein F66182_7998, partial [Fusarium sp. NRRL 66182]
CSNALVKGDDSNYWFPSLYFHDPETGEFEDVEFDYFNAYYFFEKTHDDIKPFPVGLQIVAGDAMTRTMPKAGSKANLDPSKGPVNPARMTCPRLGNDYTLPSWNPDSDGTLAGVGDAINQGEGVGFPDRTCDGQYSPLRADVHFPSCYNPEAGLTDFENNMAYPEDNDGYLDCPEGWIHVPHLFYESYWRTDKFQGRWEEGKGKQPFVFSNGDVTGYSSHADFMAAWDTELLQHIIDTCNAGTDGMDNCPGLFYGLNKDECTIESEVDEKVTGTMSKLPGDNPLSGWSYGDNETPSKPSDSDDSGSSPSKPSVKPSATKPASEDTTTAVEVPSYAEPAFSAPVEAAGDKTTSAPNEPTLTSQPAVESEASAEASEVPSTAPKPTNVFGKPGNGKKCKTRVHTVWNTVTVTQTASVPAQTEPAAPPYKREHMRRHAHHHGSGHASIYLGSLGADITYTNVAAAKVRLNHAPLNDLARVNFLLHQPSLVVPNMSLYHEAAEILTGSSSEGGSLKSRVFKKKNLKSSPNQVYALVLESCKWSPILKEVIEKSELLQLERKLTPTLSLLLVHDLLLAKKGIALPQGHGLRASVERHKGRISSEFKLARLRRKMPSLEALKEQVERQSAGEEANYPRWVRINAVKSTLEEQLETTFSKYSRASSIKEVVYQAGRFLYIDPHVPNLVAVTSGIDLTKTEAYMSGKIILQDKASCFPAYLLDPRSEDGDLIDACSAPGNKTTHLAAILKEHRPEFDAPGQTIYAFEKDSRRAQTLEKMVKIAGSRSMTQIGFGQDFLQVDPQSDKYKSVGALLLDPSCSGSGIVGRDSMPDLHLPEGPVKAGKGAATNPNNRKRKHDQAETQTEKLMIDDDGNETVVKSDKDLESRLEALSSFQLTLLLHAFRFPSARKITYSTCSVHMQENEGVVMRALESDIAKEKGWRILSRQDQVSGMRDWPVRGLPTTGGDDREVAAACIRSYKDDGQGVMGFFVAAFVRPDVQDAKAAGDDEGPYIRDEGGMIVRDMLGMPVLKSTGEPMSLTARGEDDKNEDQDGNDEDEQDDSGSETESSKGSDSAQNLVVTQIASVEGDAEEDG